MAEAHERARGDLHAWRASVPANFYTSNRQLGRLLRSLADPGHVARHEAHYARFGAVVAVELDAAAIVNNREGNLPRLDRFSPYGIRTEGIDNHPAYDVCGRAIYEDGEVIAAYAEPASNLRAQALFYLSSHVGEAAHNCPVACTAGVAKILLGPASPELREAFLARVLDRRYAERFDGAQFLTELQGGSDVGANAVEARPDGEAYGTTRWRIHGEKWFCSNPGADLILMTARIQGAAPGTGGLGLFLVPRALPGGRTNDFRLRRLKEKLGTRSMPSAEIDFEGAEAYAIGRVEDGFKHVMNHVINTSRLYNSVGCAGISRRAHLEATAYARARRAFGRPVAEFPLMQEMLAGTYATASALTAGALTLAAEADRVERGEGITEAHRAFLRIATNLVKMRSCQHSHRTVLTGIETLGGNGAIESFSVLPRLLRDNVVYENWEGTHNTLVAQTVRDMQRPALRDGFFAGVAEWLDRARPVGALLADVRTAVEEARALCGDLPKDEGFAALALRPHADALADALFALAYACDLMNEGSDDVRAAETAALAHFVASHLGERRPARNATYAARLAAIMTIA